MSPATPPEVTEHVASSQRHTTAYLACLADEHLTTPIIFVHGWPELSWSWRHQMPYFAALGYRTYAPDMRGYGNSSVYQQQSDYAQQHVVADMVELLDHLGADQAIWVGHDWGSPTVWSLATHHPDRCRAIANLCVPFNTLERGWAGLLPYIDRSLYPEDEYPAGQWEYQLYYAEAFAEATATFDSDPYKVAKLMFRRGNPEGQGKVSGTALTRKNGGWFGGDIPDLPRDDSVVSEEDLTRYAQALKKNTFFGPDSYYVNHDANAAYYNEAVRHDIDLPVLFLHARYDYTCETLVSNMAEPMRAGCHNLTEQVVDSGHWMAQEQPDMVNQHLHAWLTQQQLSP